MKNIFFFLFYLVTSNLLGQVTSVDYLMKYNCETNQYDVNIVILEGSATSIPHRAQFNSQVSIVVPTGESLEITEMYMPLQNNQSYSGTIPLDWNKSTPLIAPSSQPENDFYGCTPTLSPASFYDDLMPGDIVKIFSFTAGTTGQYDENVRFFKNGIDPSSNQPGMGGFDLSNGFTIGGSTQTFNNSIEESCITSVDNDVSLSATLYPNPFQNQFTIELPNDVKQISVLGSTGEVYYRSVNTFDKALTINAFNYARGVYFVRMEFNNGTFKNQKIVKL